MLGVWHISAVLGSSHPGKSARSQMTPSVTPKSYALFQSVACKPAESHLDLLHHPREHVALFKSLLTSVLDYSHLHSLTLFHSRKHLGRRRGRSLPTNTPLACGDIQTKPDFLIPPMTETALNENIATIIHQQESYVTYKTLTHAPLIKMPPHKKAQPQAQILDF